MKPPAATTITPRMATSRIWRVLRVAFMALLSAASELRASLKWGIRGDRRQKERARSPAPSACSPSASGLAGRGGAGTGFVRVHRATRADDLRGVRALGGRDAVASG